MKLFTGSNRLATYLLSPSFAMSLEPSSVASRALFIVQRHHAGFLDSFGKDRRARLWIVNLSRARILAGYCRAPRFAADAAPARLQRAYALAQREEANIYRFARNEYARRAMGEWRLDHAIHRRMVSDHCDHQRGVLVRTIREFAPELVRRGHTSFQVIDSIYGKVRRNAVAKMRRFVNLGSARKRAGY